MKNIDDILAKHFSGETSADEANLVMEWKSKNSEEFDLLSEAWNTADENLLKDRTFKTFDAKLAWNKVDEQLVSESVEKETKIIKVNFYKKVAAACAILLVGLSGFWFLNDANGFDSVANTENAPKEILLPDGTNVWLASNATLEYNKDFVNDRTLKLTGEAFFEVARDEAHPFIVNTLLGDIEVLGTAFNVNATTDVTNVSVDHGKVAVRNKNGEVLLTVGESANATAKSIIKNNSVETNYDSWKTGKFNFESTPLTEVVDLLNKHYKTQVSLETDKQVFLNGNFDNVPIDAIIEVIVLTCNVKTENGKDIIRLK